MNPIDIDITFPQNNGTFLAGQPITIRGVARWTTPSDELPFATLLMTAFESRFNGVFWTRWVQVGDVDVTEIQQANSTNATWQHEVIPFDGMARYLLNVYAFDRLGNQVGSSEPLMIRSVS